MEAGEAIREGTSLYELLEYAKNRDDIEIIIGLNVIGINYKDTTANEYKGKIDFTGIGIERYEKDVPENLSGLLVGTNNMIIVDENKYQIKKPFEFAKEFYRQNEKDEEIVEKMGKSTIYPEEKTLAEYCSMKPTK